MDTINFDWGLLLQILEIALALGLVTGFGAIVRTIYIYATRSSIDKVLIRKYNVYDIMQQVLSEIDGDRMLLIKIHNGGDAPKVTSVLKSTIIQEVFRSPLGSVKMDWQDREVDMAYIQMLIDLNKADHKRIVVYRSLMKDGMLKTTYEAQDVYMSCLHYIKAEKKAMYFLAVNYASANEPTPYKKARLEDLVSQVRHLI